nr:hypothetical protein [Tanacetum cinerariifolium]
ESDPEEDPEEYEEDEAEDGPVDYLIDGGDDGDDEGDGDSSGYDADEDEEEEKEEHLAPADSAVVISSDELPPRKRLCLATLGSRYEVGESSTRGRGVDYRFANTVEAEMRHRGIREVGNGIRDTWIDPAE